MQRKRDSNDPRPPRGRIPNVPVLAVGFLLVASMLVTGAPDADETIQACYATNSGHIRIVADAGDCKKNEQPISWNQIGPEGPQGPPGPIGPEGAQGPPGPAGPADLADLEGTPCSFDGAEGTVFIAIDGLGKIHAYCVTGSANAPFEQFRDRDGDGFGNDTETNEAPELLAGYAFVGGDCDDTAATVNPDAEEIVNDVDDDCDGEIDGGQQTGSDIGACSSGVDGEGEVGPEPEYPGDGIDNDCDGQTDEGPWLLTLTPQMATDPASPHVLTAQFTGDGGVPLEGVPLAIEVWRSDNGGATFVLHDWVVGASDADGSLSFASTDPGIAAIDGVVACYDEDADTACSQPSVSDANKHTGDVTYTPDDHVLHIDDTATIDWT